MDSLKSQEILGVERQQVGQPINGHRCDQSRVMYFCARDAMQNYEPAPLLVNRFTFGQKAHSLFYRGDDLSASSGVKPNPFNAIGRVATFQNSAMFWWV
ncbi:MAG: hypothetical protein ABI824_18535 [Acidobacteriota bacterium]